MPGPDPVGEGAAVMGTLIGYDSAEPLAHPPGGDLVAFYGGGDTPHIWTLAEIEAQPVRYRLPIWVRSNPMAIGVSVTVDVENFLIYLVKVGCPKGVATSLDLETAVAPNYVNIFGSLMRAEGYLVLPYGSSGNLFKNPVLDGYWVDLPGAKAIPSNCIGVQYSQGGSGAWDNDWFLDSIPFWDSQPPIPIGQTTEKDQMSIALGPDGTQYIERVQPGTNHLLRFIIPPITLVDPNPKALVMDVTDNLKAQFPNNPDYLVQP